MHWRTRDALPSFGPALARRYSSDMMWNGRVCLNVWRCCVARRHDRGGRCCGHLCGVVPCGGRCDISPGLICGRVNDCIRSGLRLTPHRRLPIVDANFYRSRLDKIGLLCACADDEFACRTGCTFQPGGFAYAQGRISQHTSSRTFCRVSPVPTPSNVRFLGTTRSGFSAHLPSRRVCI